jgi:Predicted membrane-associated Zn-dependent proteases 1
MYFLYIILMLLILGVLVSLHEAGHLAFAKLFHVYCFDYSIGFGPSFLHVKRKNGETYFSLRVIPLGGYVSMYGEPGIVPEGFSVPGPERSVEGIAQWKKAIILVAGVAVNYLLGVILIFIAVSPIFTQYYYGYSMNVKSPSTGETTLLATYAPASFSGDFKIAFDAAKDPSIESKDYYFFEGTRSYPDLNTQSSVGPIVDSDVTIFDQNGTPYSEGGVPVTFVAVYTPDKLASAHSLASELHLFPASTVDPISVSPLYAQIGVTHFPDLSVDSSDKSKEFDPSLLSSGEVYFDLDVKLFALTRDTDGNPVSHWEEAITVPARISVEEKVWSDPGLSIEVISARNTWSDTWDQFSSYVPYANSAIVQGIGNLLFTANGWKQASGLPSMAAALMKMDSVSTILQFSGIISINLAFFNLLPFPGLDGFGLLVTLIEAIVNAIKRTKFKKAHQGEKIVEILPPLETEEQAKAKQRANRASAKPSNDVTVVVEAAPEAPKAAPLPSLKEGEVAYIKWRIPAKIKGWLSFIGIGLLFLLAILVTIQDIIKL